MSIETSIIKIGKNDKPMSIDKFKEQTVKLVGQEFTILRIRNKKDRLCTALKNIEKMFKILSKFATPDIIVSFMTTNVELKKPNTLDREIFCADYLFYLINKNFKIIVDLEVRPKTALQIFALKGDQFNMKDCKALLRVE